MDILANGTMEEVWKEIEAKLTENSAPYATLKATYEIQITDEEESYQLSFKEGGFSITTDYTENADCALKMKNATFRRFLSGNLNSMTAFITGKLKVDGNIGLALNLESVLKEYSF